MDNNSNWRDDPSLRSIIEYKRHFAFRRVICHDGTKVWLKFYYAKYKNWGTDWDFEYGLHTDFIENITEEEYVVRKLSESL